MLAALAVVSAWKQQRVYRLLQLFWAAEVEYLFLLLPVPHGHRALIVDGNLQRLVKVLRRSVLLS